MSLSKIIYSPPLTLGLDKLLELNFVDEHSINSGRELGSVSGRVTSWASRGGLRPELEIEKFQDPASTGCEMKDMTIIRPRTPGNRVT